MLKNKIQYNSHFKKCSVLLQALVLITLTACGDSEQGSDVPIDPNTPITVDNYTPPANATAVQINSSIDVLFSESIELPGMQATIDVATTQGSVAGSSVISADKLTFTPSEDLNYASEYTVTIGSATTSARAITATSWGFSTDSAPLEPIAPITVTSHTPAANATAVQINSNIDVLFSESVELSGMQVTIDVTTTEGPVAGSSVISADKLTFTPSADLDYASEYTVTIGSATTSARAITASSWDFSTDAAPIDPIVPITVTSHTPAANATAVQIDSSIDVLFSESIELSGMQATIDVENAQGPVAGSIVISADELIFTPSEDLDYASEYTVTISSAATSAREITETSSVFTTVVAPENPEEPVVPVDPVDPAPSDPQHFTLTSIESSGNTLVTMGIPFAPGMLASTDTLKVFNESGQEVQIFVKPTLQWHFKAAPENTVRAVKVQFYADMNSGEVNTYSWDIGQSRDTAQDLSEQDLSGSLTASTISGKAGVDIPKIVAIHQPDYLAEAQLIEPFKPEADDNHKTYTTAQFAWAKNLNFESSALADWLFDRPTALYKMCMRTGQADCYIEAIQSYHYWKSNLVTQGQASYPDCAGGLNINGSSKACDTKYLYLEPIKIHTALTGIDNLFSDKVLLKKMADLADETHYQGDNSDEYDVDDSFTERSAGITLLAKVIAYELLPEHAESILANINQRIDVLYDMQQTPQDGFAVEGAFRHSWARHEGQSYPGVVADDRRFSPWMSENTTDALWHQYQITKSVKIKEMLLDMARGMLNWGFVTSSGYTDKFGSNLSDLPNGESWNSSCSLETNGYKPIALYSGSSTADDQALISTQNSNGQSSDAHNPEVVLMLAMGYKFSDDAAEKEKFNNLIQDIYGSYFTESCGSNGATKRKFNWNNRSNAWGTYLFLKTSS
ncbi:Ig-like domain-containing protein [Colwelliaceae bacterium BS250]